MQPIVFLHIPKTAGQTIHHALAARVGLARTSPVRVRDQAVDGRQMPPGYLLHSGHIDWTELELIGGHPFVFTVLRDPAERIGSFYFYMLNKARVASWDELRGPGAIGLRMIRAVSADAYFLGGDLAWQRFVRNIYFNFYCSYLATRKFGGRAELEGLASGEIVARALTGSRRLDRIYSSDALEVLEADIATRYGWKIRVAGNFKNVGQFARGERRWPRLLQHLESDKSMRRLEAFVAEDRALMARLEIAHAQTS